MKKKESFEVREKVLVLTGDVNLMNWSLEEGEITCIKDCGYGKEYCFYESFLNSYSEDKNVFGNRVFKYNKVLLNKSKEIQDNCKKECSELYQKFIDEIQNILMKNKKIKSGNYKFKIDEITIRKPCNFYELGDTLKIKRIITTKTKNDCHIKYGAEDEYDTFEQRNLFKIDQNIFKYGCFSGKRKEINKLREEYYEKYQELKENTREKARKIFEPKGARCRL